VRGTDREREVKWFACYACSMLFPVCCALGSGVGVRNAEGRFENKTGSRGV